MALLRGVNVGMAKRVPMAAFRSLLEGLGYSGVATVLNSGNAVFRSSEPSEREHERRIAEALEAQVGVRAPVFVERAVTLAAIVDANPIPVPEADAGRCLVVFARDAATLQALQAIEARVVPPERFAVRASAAYLLCPGGIRDSEAAKAVLGRAGGEVTTRNWATTLKLRAIADKAADSVGDGAG